jgi:hypothetical protein
MTDADTTAAVEALAYRLRERDVAMRDGAGHADAEVFAREFVTALRGRGWRPTEARVLPAWKPAAGVSGGEPPRDLLDGLRADLDAKAAAFRGSDGEPGSAA